MTRKGDPQHMEDQEAGEDSAAMEAIDPKVHYHGHRKRLKDRFLRAGSDGLADYELVELLLAIGIPRRDVKPLAKEMLAKFGSFGALVTAPIDELRRFKGMTENAAIACKIVRAAASELARELVMDKPLLSNWDALIDYLRAEMAHSKREEFRLLFMNNKNVLIGEEIHGRGTVDEVNVHIREVIKSALDRGATAIVIAHNHPSGNPTPSRSDIAMTKAIADTCANLKIKLHDHVVIGKHGHASFKTMGLI